MSLTSLLKTGILEKHRNSNVLFELHADLAEVYMIESEPDSDATKFVLIWGDYVANAWEEEFDLLSTATARMATLLHVLEREPEGEIIGFRTHGEAFNTAWATFIADTTEIY